MKGPVGLFLAKKLMYLHLQKKIYIYGKICIYLFEKRKSDKNTFMSLR